jgi:hypothetical protein
MDDKTFWQSEAGLLDLVPHWVGCVCLSCRSMLDCSAPPMLAVPAVTSASWSSSQAVYTQTPAQRDRPWWLLQMCASFADAADAASLELVNVPWAGPQAVTCS